jgi:glycosyltransferase involved in cell wall biosynthesis
MFKGIENTQNKILKMTAKKVLLITYSFPPKGGPGVQRNLKFVKYFPEFGWKPFVLTSKDLFYPVKDYDLLKEIPSTAVIIRTETLDPLRIFYLLKLFISKIKKSKKNELAKDVKKVAVNESSLFYKIYRLIRRWFFIPDSAILWLPFALWKGYFLVKREKIEVLIGSCPGPSSLILAYLLAKLTGTRFVFDFRDGWTDYPYNDYPTKFHKRINALLEKWIIPKADKLIVFGEFLTNIYSSKYNLPKDKFIEISNGFDPADFEHLPKKNNVDNRIRIVHSGNVMEFRKAVFENLVKAVKQLPEEFLNKICFDFIGNVNEASVELVKEMNLESVFTFYGYHSHHEALQYLGQADATLILLPEGDFAAVTGKVFEYVAIGKTIISIAEPQGGCSKLVASINSIKTTAHPDNIQEIISVLKNCIENDFPKLKIDIIEKYSRKNHTKIMADVLNELVKHD